MIKTLLGPLTSFASEPGVTDIAVTSDGRVWVDKGCGMTERNLDIGRLSPQAVRDFAIQLCASLGKRLDDACPIADASSRDGIRVHAVLEPIVPQGASLSIRLPQHRLNTLEQLEAQGMFPSEWTRLLHRIISAHQSILICGGTGAGKTTLVKALLSVIPHGERVVIVEEIHELEQSLHHNSESLVMRESNVEGVGEITLSDLVRATVRMRPDRIVLGECRGEEVADLLRALNSGHRGSIATLHADSIERVPSRLCTLGLLAHISVPAMSQLAAGAFDVVIHIVRSASGRHISHIGRLCVSHDGQLYGQRLCSWDGHGAVRKTAQYADWYNSLSNQDSSVQIDVDSTIEFSRVEKGDL
ncbi:CpaF family protein [Alloscardovia omnicolens]|uniref:CpaF family protein n=1 Tax=Alloscardovia omnicolens TaxID=419015 RepID=UPI003A603EDB